MGLQLVLGGSGSGKTTFLCEGLIDKSKNIKDGHFLIIVPEQYTMEMQKNIVRLSKEMGTMNIDILSFDRLAKRIFDEVGISHFSVLDDTGKCLIIRKIIEENKDNLVMFGQKAGMTGFIDEVKSIVSELYQYGIGENELDKIIEMTEKKPLLNAKLKDIRLIITKIKEKIQDNFVINEELLQRVCELIPKSELMDNCYIVFDEYTGFTPVQYKVISNLLENAKEVSVALTIRDGDKIDFDKANPDTDVFGIAIKTVCKLKEIAKDLDVEIYSDIILNKNKFYNEKKDLYFLEKNLFKFGIKPYEDNTENISIHVCNNAFDEADYVAYNIKKLVIKSGYRFKDIAVVTPDIEGYYRAINESFYKHDIPCFIDYKRSIITNPMVETIRAALEIVEDNYSYDAVFRYLKTGMSSLSMDEVDIFENYVIKMGIKGRSRYEKNIQDESLELIRRKFFDDINDIYELMGRGRKAKVSDALTVLYNFVLKLNMEEKIYRYAKAFKTDNDLSREKEYSQTYGKVMELFDKAVGLIGDEKMTIRDLAAVLDSGFEEIKVGVIPPTLDRVVVGDIERTRLNNVKVLFLIGANDGLIPKSEGKGGIITRNERNFLYENEVTLAPTTKENAFIQKYYLYILLTKMSDKLFISFKRIGSEGSVARQSYIIQNIIKMFPKVTVVNEDRKVESEKLQKITNYSSAKEFLAENIYDYLYRDLDDYDKKLFREIYSFCVNNDIDISKYIEAAGFNVGVTPISQAVAKAIYGVNLHNSVSRLENFAACAYRHFLDYGLALQPRREYEIGHNDMGNIYHKSIELFFKKVTDRKISWEKMDDEIRELLVKESMREAVALEGSDVFSDTARNAYVLEKINRITGKTVKVLQEQIKAGKFVPTDFEVRFSSDYGLDNLKYVYEDGSQMGLRGVIDRVDYYNDGDDIYVKIIDYKSGNKKMELQDIYNGLQLQLVLYMEAAVEFAKRKNEGKNIIPAGMFYYNIDDPVIDGENVGMTEGKTEEEKKVILEIAKRQVLEQLRPIGMFNEQKYILEAFDKNLDELMERQGNSIAFPANYGKRGMKKNDNAITVEQMETLIKFVHNKVGELGGRILQGEIDLNPYINQSVHGILNEHSVPCTYCEYNGICGFDRRVKGCNYRRFEKLDNSAIWEKMREENIENGMDN